MRSLVVVLVGAIILSFCSFAAYAEDQAPAAPAATTVAPAPAAPAPAPAAAAPAAAPTVGSMTVDELRKALGFSLYFQGGYVYNTRNPSSQENDLRHLRPRGQQLHPRPRPDQVPEGRGRGRSRLQFQIFLRRNGEVHPFPGLGPQDPNSPQDESGFTNSTPFDLTQANRYVQRPYRQGPAVLFR